MGQIPLTDAFGSRLDPKDLVAGLDARGLAASRLVARDDGFELLFAGHAIGDDAPSLATTWLRTQLSPIIPVTPVRVAPNELTPDSERWVDLRTRRPEVVAFVECASPGDFAAATASLLERAAGGTTREDRTATVGSGDVPAPELDDERLRPVLERLAADWTQALQDAGFEPDGASLVWLAPTAASVRPVGRMRSPGPHLVGWWRPGGPTGVAPRFVLAASAEAAALDWLIGALDDPVRSAGSGREVLLDGLVWGVTRRPTIAAPPADDGAQILVDSDRCDGCGDCASACPTGYLDDRGRPTTPDPARCVRCFECVDLCPTDALRPVNAADSTMSSRALEHRDGWLSRLRGAPGPLVPAPFPPSWLRPSPSSSPPRVVLGLAVMTMQEHAAALVVDGELVGAVEEEKLVRIRHYGWRAPGRPPFITPAVDPTLCLEEVLCRRSVRALLADAGLTLDDVDLIAVNGLHGRFRHMFSLTDADAPIPLVTAGRVTYVPHHLCHAASSFRVSGADAGWVFTVDGRGDRETAAVFRGEEGELRPVATLLSLTDRSIGGVYEGVTRLLGFGTHGQGSVMALAGFGEPRVDVSEFLDVRSVDRFTIHESGINEAFAGLRREFEAPLTEDHHDLAASVQNALEEAAVALVGDVVDDAPVESLCMSGGVSLNCHMNQRLRLAFRPERVFAQPGANDGGTAIGAAAEALFAAGGPASLQEMEHALLGPEFDDDAIEAVLRRSGLEYERVDDVAGETARRIASGSIVCWFQGRLEFGPRALGARSIVADPRSEETKDRVNRLKERQAWRPFGPSMLAGTEDDWLETAFDSRFMLFTLPVRPERRSEIPAVVHVDGTTRPQVVHAHTHPRYHAMISAFNEATGVPMVLNTSFNRRGEPIVCTPEDAVDAFLGLGADALAIGSFIVPRPEDPVRAGAVGSKNDTAALAALPGGRRLSLRLTTECDLDCVHCMLRDTKSHGDRSTAEAMRALVEGREAGCDELVILRGEVLLRADVPELVRAARAMGYRFVQLQLHGAALAVPGPLEELLDARVDAFEMQLVAGDQALHDELTRRQGSFRRVAAAIQRVARSGAELILAVPVLRANRTSLRKTVLVAGKLGAKRVQFVFPRPVELPREADTGQLLSLTAASAYVRQAAAYAESLGLVVTTEGFPLCHLDERYHGTPDATEDFGRHRIDDLAILHDERSSSRGRMRPEAAPCRGCALAGRCPKTWALYLELCGSDELHPVAG